MRNLEIKLCLSEAEFIGLWRRLETAPEAEVLRQIDTYFIVAAGRLKLRQIEQASGDAAELIAYHRPDVASARWSSYDRLSLAPPTAALLRAMLAGTAGIAAVVDKQRLVVVRARTRIHLDEVAGLGTFLEIETVAGDNEPVAGIDRELAATLEWLGVDPTARPAIAGSYLELTRDQLPDTAGADA